MYEVCLARRDGELHILGVVHQKRVRYRLGSASGITIVRREVVVDQSGRLLVVIIRQRHGELGVGLVGRTRVLDDERSA